MGRLAEQDRAKFAHDRIQKNRDAGGETNGKLAGEYRQLVMGLPAMIQQCGLGQTMAFLASKGKGHHAMALADLEEWLERFDYAKGKDGVLKALMDGDSRGYRMATTEALAYLQWLKRFAEAAIEKPERGTARG
ncbi:CRISPR type III-B/RAMP module-associated protein Cmr5 [Nitrospira tepida]|uniref:CRISPR type III-B/RAMP module-associated protein Cmr5 n=1 Tax=Nitrospira tepida TaxID=2973512 RepID=A0AA86MYA5_9BACT|nr:type III-B CRISPR module-associated protein Cmr5 [Nitrospira tepida]CAI4031137.1 CRISPR type III-B/RAMP module-associated protein Cmr5 [Nitrospira tepida]